MTIWEIEHDSYDFVSFFPVEEEKRTLDYLRSFDGTRKLHEWKAIEVVSDREKMQLPITDFPGFMAVPLLVFSDRGKGLLEALITNDVEFLPINFGLQSYYLVNVISRLDCVNMERTAYVRFKSTGRIMKYKSLSFLPDAIKGHHLFWLKDGPRRYFVSDEFRKIVMENNLTGFSFKLIDEV